jgi:hypothetical protein
MAIGVGLVTGAFGAIAAIWRWIMIWAADQTDDPRRSQ